MTKISMPPAHQNLENMLDVQGKYTLTEKTGHQEFIFGNTEKRDVGIDALRIIGIILFPIVFMIAFIILSVLRSNLEKKLSESRVLETIATPVIEAPVIPTPVAVIEAPVIEEPVIEEPVIEEPVIEEPVVAPPPVIAPVIATPVAVVEEPLLLEVNFVNMTDADFFTLLTQVTKDRIIPALYPCFKFNEINHNFREILSRKKTAIQIMDNGQPKFLHANMIGHYLDQDSLSLDTAISTLSFSKKSIAMQAPWVYWELYISYFFQSEVNIIVDLTNDNESVNQIYRATQCYPADKGVEIEQPENITIAVSCTSCEKTDKVCIYDYQLALNDRIKEMKRIQFPNWEDHNGITSEALFNLIETLENYLLNPDDPIIVHCKAGVGRTGTFIVARELYHLHKTQSTLLDNLDQTIFRLIIQGRCERGPDFVQTRHQVKCLREFGKHLLTQ